MTLDEMMQADDQRKLKEHDDRRRMQFLLTLDKDGGLPSFRNSLLLRKRFLNESR
jgi:hypothetical protein